METRNVREKQKTKIESRNRFFFSIRLVRIAKDEGISIRRKGRRIENEIMKKENKKKTISNGRMLK